MRIHRLEEEKPKRGDQTNGWMHEDNDGLGSQSVTSRERRQTADRMNDELPQPTITPYSIHIHPKLNFYPPIHSFRRVQPALAPAVVVWCPCVAHTSS
ncbi:hypothetical protein niasHT_025515 [Heterodera trifolii]|uniref:Uncharacterized protein n=1 Tax=Heterodera trifolii TaxID=157864 RepID=A0ABD2J8S2_9BILA